MNESNNVLKEYSNEKGVSEKYTNNCVNSETDVCSTADTVDAEIVVCCCCWCFCFVCCTTVNCVCIIIINMCDLYVIYYIIYKYIYHSLWNILFYMNIFINK